MVYNPIQKRILLKLHVLSILMKEREILHLFKLIMY